MSKLVISEDGRVFRDGHEIFELTIHEQDQIISHLYPGDPALMSVGDIRKKQRSHSGIHGLDLSQFQSLSEPYVDVGSCAMAERVYKWGGQRLLTLYCHKFHFHGAAMDLNMEYGALMKWFQRFRAKTLAMGLTPEALFRNPEEVINP